MPLRDDLASALALLTRLPVPDHRPAGAAGVWAWPLAGAVVGAAGALAGMAALAAGAVPGVAAALALAVQAWLTGGLHEDGLADCADGFSGGRDRAARLAIMKDSRIGSHGALALVVVTLARWAALAALLTAGDGGAIIAAAVLSRAVMPAVMAALPAARPGGLSALVGRPDAGRAGLAAGLALAVALAAAGTAALAMALAAATAAAAVALLARARIGGQTGDVLGAAQQVAEAAALALA